jgi:hypothetical protein
LAFGGDGRVLRIVNVVHIDTYHVGEEGVRLKSSGAE